MNRLIALGLGLAWAGAAAAQTGGPGSPPPAPVSAAQAWPTAPTVPPAAACTATPAAGYGNGFGGDAPCGTPLFPGVGPKPGDRTCLNKVLDFVCYKPGPSVLPVFTPTPFHAPLRTYFPCKPDATCAPPCAPGVGKVRPAPNVGFRLVNMPESECRKPMLSERRGECRKPLLQGACSPRFLNGGLFVRSPGCCPSQGPVAYGAVPRPVPLFSGCETCGGLWTTGFGRVGSVLDGCLGWLLPGRTSSSYAFTGGEMYPGCTGANCYPTGAPGPTLAGYRFANPVGYPVPMGAYPAATPTPPTPAYQQQTAAVPFTNP